MKKLNRFISLALTLGLALSVMATSVSASKFVDAHGNEVELDDTLEAYSSVVLSGADNAARKAETNLGDLWTDALRWFAVSGKINAYFDEDDVAAGNTKVDVDADHIVALWNGGNLRADIAVGKFGAAELAAVLPYPNKVAVIYMSGAQLLEALEAASQALPYGDASADACASFMPVSYTHLDVYKRQVDISAFAELIKQPPGQRLVTVNLPETGALVIDGVIFDEAPHILRRIAEKQPYLVGKFAPGAEALGQIGHALLTAVSYTHLDVYKRQAC